MGDKDLQAQQEARDAVEAASFAFQTVSKLDQAKIDEICAAMSRVALANAERLGKMAHEETGFGKAEDKREKNRFAAEDVWNHFKTLKTVGVVNDSGSVVEIASPRGVVAAIIPSTNPTSTAIFKIIISIKSRNTIVLSPHPSAANCIAETTRVMREEAVKLGLPHEAIHCLTTTSLEGTETLMKHRKTAVILATGGTGLVRAAYSSGKPAFGVGPGNVPFFIDKTANAERAVFNILTGTDTNFDFNPLTDRPNAVAPGSAPTSCGNSPVLSKYSPTGAFNLPCYIDVPAGSPAAAYTGNLARNVGTKPFVVFTDLRIAKSFMIREKLSLQVMADGFNLINKNNTLDVNLLYTAAGQETAASDPRQFQFGARLSF